MNGFCVRHTWHGGEALFFAADENQAQIIEIAIARDRVASEELAGNWIERLMSEDHETAHAAVSDYCNATEDELFVSPISPYPLDDVSEVERQGVEVDAMCVLEDFVNRFPDGDEGIELAGSMMLDAQLQAARVVLGER